MTRGMSSDFNRIYNQHDRNAPPVFKILLMINY